MKQSIRLGRTDDHAGDRIVLDRPAGQRRDVHQLHHFGQRPADLEARERARTPFARPNPLGVVAGRARQGGRGALEALELLRSGDYDILLVSSYLPDLYVGDFFERLNRLPVRPCSIIMNEGRTPAATISEMKSMIGEVKCQ